MTKGLDGDHWGHSFPNILRFEASAIGDAFKTTLDYLPNVQIIRLKPYSIGDQDAWVLNLFGRLGTTDSMLCPYVRYLNVGDDAY